MAESLPRLTMGELANRVLASQDDARTALAVQLARGTRSPDQIEAMADRFLGAGDAGRQAFLEWIARVRAPLPQTTTRRIAALLSDRSISPAVRIQAAARLLKTI